MPKPVQTVDRIVIRAWPNDLSNPIALFMDQPEPNGMVNSYQHVGQHSPADPGIVRETVALHSQHRYVQALVTELRQIGYNPRILSRFQRSRS